MNVEVLPNILGGPPPRIWYVQIKTSQYDGERVRGDP